MKLAPFFISFFWITLFIQNGYAQTTVDYFTSGNEKLEQKDYKAAIREYTKALALEPNNADIYFSRAYCKSMASDHVGGANPH